nr:Gag-Pol polyprotein [Tanacetum cinerariifolium]
LNAQLQDKNIVICELKKLIDKYKKKSVEAKFDKPFVVRQPNAQRIPKPSVLGKSAPFSDSLERKYFSKTKSVPKIGVSEGLLKPVTTQNLPQTAKQAASNTKVIKSGMYQIDSKTTQTRAPQDLQGNDLLTGDRGSDLYTITLQETTSSTPLYLMAKASPTQAWLWHQRFSYLNFDYINLVSKKDAMIGLTKIKYLKDQLCSSCEVSKAKRSSFKTKTVPNSEGRLNLLHMDLCGPMRVASINGRKDGENLDKKKEKQDPCILVGYSTRSKGYRVYNKRTRLIVESIHLQFDEIKEMPETSVANDTLGLVSQRQKASDYDHYDPVPQLQNVSPLADTSVPSQQELDLLFGPLYDEFFNSGTSSINKSSSPTDNSKQ